MKCKAIFNINGEEISLDLDTDQDTLILDLPVLEALKNNLVIRNALADKIGERLKDSGTLKKITKKDFLDNGATANCDLEYIKLKFPHIEFPDGISAKVFLHGGVSVGTLKYNGRVVNPNGEEVFMTNGTDKDLMKLSAYLKIKKQLNDGTFNFAEDENYSLLNKVLEEKNKLNLTSKLTDVNSMIIDFLNNKSKYAKLFVDGKSAYEMLQSVANLIFQVGGRKKFNDEFVNFINGQFKYIAPINSNKKRKEIALLDLDVLYAAIKNYHPDILTNLKITSLDKFKEFFSKDSSETSELLKIFGNIKEGKGYLTLLNYLFSPEPEFLFKVLDINDKSINFSSIPRSLSEAYDIGYDTIKTFKIVDNDYKGFKIYTYKENGVDIYIPSENYLTENTYVTRFSNIDDAKSYIDRRAANDEIYKHAFLEFKFRISSTDEKGNITYTDELPSFEIETKLYLEEKSMIESLDIPIVENTFINNGESIFLEEKQQNYNTFMEEVQRWGISDKLKSEIANNINTAEKVATFIYKINELAKADRSSASEEIISKIVDDIKNASRKAYYILSKRTEKGKLKYFVIPVNAVQVEEYQTKDKSTPIVSLAQAISETLKDKFGVTVEMKTSSELLKEFPSMNVDTTKAFIKDGTIYFNTTTAKSTDMLHEYVHLLLGVLKSSSELNSNYELLLDLVAHTDEGKRKLIRLRKSYPELSEISLREEVFASLFSERVMGKLNSGFDHIFETNDKLLKKGTQLIFDTEIANLEDFYGNTLQSVFLHFNHDVALLLKGPKVNFSETKKSRFYSNWISKKIKEKVIEENCE